MKEDKNKVCMMKNKLKIRDFFFKVSECTPDDYSKKVVFFYTDECYLQDNICAILDNYKALKKPGFECQKKINKETNLRTLYEIIVFYKIGNRDALDYEIIFFDSKKCGYYVTEILIRQDSCAIILSDKIISVQDYEKYNLRIILNP